MLHRSNVLKIDDFLEISSEYGKTELMVRSGGEYDEIADTIVIPVLNGYDIITEARVLPRPLKYKAESKL